MLAMRQLARHLSIPIPFCPFDLTLRALSIARMSLAPDLVSSVSPSRCPLRACTRFHVIYRSLERGTSMLMANITETLH